jgi:hypothetical protein
VSHTAPKKVRNGLDGVGFKRAHGTKTGLSGVGPGVGNKDQGANTELQLNLEINTILGWPKVV